MKLRSHNWIFVRPLWRGFAIAPPVAVFVYLAILILVSVFGLVDYQGPPDEEYYIRDPAIIAMNFVFLSIVACVTALLCGLPLIYVLKKCNQLSSWSLILGATILGAVVLPVEMAAAGILFEGKPNWSGVSWIIAVGATSGGFTAFVFRIVVGMKEGSHITSSIGE